MPKQYLIAITGVSGSGKSSLAFDTLFAEGQRRYLEYLSPQARSWIKQMPKPNIDLIEGLSPTLAIGQGRQALSSRGIVATYTDIYDFLCLFYAKVGEQHSPATGKKLVRYSRQEIIDLILKDYPQGTRIQLLAPIKFNQESPQEAIQRLQQLGYIRLRINNQEWNPEELLPIDPIQQLEVVVDRLEIKEGIRERLSGSVETAIDLSQGILKVQEGRAGSIRYFTEIYVCPETGFSFAPLSNADFNFNSPHGACPVCQGQGGQERVNQDLLLLDPEQSLAEQVQLVLDALPRKLANTWQTVWSAFLDKNGIKEEMQVEKVPQKLIVQALKGSSQDLVITALVEEEPIPLQTSWKGLIPLIDLALQDKKMKGNLSELPFVQWQACPACQGARLKPEALACLIYGKNIYQLCTLTVSDLIREMEQWHFSGKQKRIVEEILPHINTRLHFLQQVGLGYLELSRQGKTLSGGEAQRIQLASQIGAKLSGILYILDEPSLGLHRQDIEHLHQVLHELKDLGNTVIFVEHERSLISQADHIIELGPGAGIHGGQLVFQGSYKEMLCDPRSLTGQWLSERLTLPKPPRRKLGKEKLSVQHAALHNLKDFSVEIPLHCLVGFCGVSGSGKSTLVQDIIGEEISKALHGHTPKWIKGYQGIVRLIQSEKQNRGFSLRSMPATYIDIMTSLRQLFAETRLAKARGYTPTRFSLNKRGGRCEVCEGLGEIRVSMQLMPDLFIPCEVCLGQRYNYETLQVTWEGHSIADILNLSVEEAFEAFKHMPHIAPKLQLMKDLGLEYLTLGQSFNTLSAGEIQRLRLVADLAIKRPEPTLYILDEPSAGLHFHDIEKLIKILHRLVNQGHSVFVVEHHLDILRQADWLIEMGPGGGPYGGQLIFQGTPEKITSTKTPTGKILKTA